MDLAELTLYDERHPAYAKVAAFNAHRLQGFLRSMVDAALEIQSPVLSHTLVKAFNFQAIAGLYATAGQYRSHQVWVSKENEEDFMPPQPFRVQKMMDIFMNNANRFLGRVRSYSLRCLGSLEYQPYPPVYQRQWAHGESYVLFRSLRKGWRLASWAQDPP